MVAKGLPCLQFFTQIPEIECYQWKAAKKKSVYTL